MQTDLFGLILVGIIWGITNPLLEKGSKEDKAQSSDLSFKSLIRTLANYKFLIPFGINQLGSGLYYYFMGQADFSLGPTIANSVCFLVTFLFENLLKGQKIKIHDVGGLLLIIVGLLLCTYK